MNLLPYPMAALKGAVLAIEHIGIIRRGILGDFPDRALGILAERASDYACKCHSATPALRYCPAFFAYTPKNFVQLTW